MRKNCSKVIIENFHEPCILYLLALKPSYGYEIKENLDHKCCCSVNIGNLYRCLSAMQKAGYVTRQSQKSSTQSKPGPDRKLYRLTPKGVKLLEKWIGELDAASKTINKFINNYKKYAANYPK